MLHEEEGIWIFLKEIKGHKPPKILLENIYALIELLCRQKKRLSECQTRLFFVSSDVSIILKLNFMVLSPEDQTVSKCFEIIIISGLLQRYHSVEYFAIRN